MRREFVFLTFLFLFAACSNVHYRFKPKSSYPVKFSGEPSDTQEVTIALKKEFYLWGLLPAQQTVYLDEEVQKLGYPSLSRLIIYEKRTSEDILLSIITFGFYNPRTIMLTGFTEK
jgi:hypothetical protein